MENNILSYCGYDCRKCPVFKATEKENLELLKQIVVTPGEEIEQTIANLGCYGCCNQKSVNHLCDKCPIRLCAKTKNVLNCGYCNNFPCDKLSNISEQTKEILTQINNTIKNIK